MSQCDPRGPVCGPCPACGSPQYDGGQNINPGGQLLSISCRETDEDIPAQIFEAMWENRNRLISGEEARRLFDAASIKELENEN